MSKIVLVFDAASSGSRGNGSGSYAIIKGNLRTVTRLEFGNGMTAHEAQYDTLITALEMLVRQESAGETVLEIRSPSQLVIRQVLGIWQTREAHLRTRLDRVRELLRHFKSATLAYIPREQANNLLAR